MEVGEEGVDGFELVGRVDEDVGFAGAFGDFAVAGQVFEDAGNGGADGGDFFGCVDFAGGLGFEVVTLGMHLVFAGVIGFDRAEGADADVQGEEGVVEIGEDFGREMEPGGGRGDGAVFFGVDGLVAVAVGFVGFAFHVVRQGEVAVFFEVGRGVPLDETFAFFVGLENGAGAPADFYGAAGFHLLAGPDEAPPMVWVGGVGADELDFFVVGKEARRDDFGVVEDEKMVGWEEFGELTEVVVGDLSGSAIDEHHA